MGFQATLLLELNDVFRQVFAFVPLNVFHEQPRLLAQLQAGALVGHVVGRVHGLHRRVPQTVAGPVQQQLGFGPFLRVAPFSQVGVLLERDVRCGCPPTKAFPLYG